MDQDLQALQGFLEETNESLQGIGNAFIELEKDPGNLEIINRIFRPVHSMKGNSGFFGLTHINKFAHRMEDLLDFIRKGEVLVDRQVIEVLLAGIDYLQQMLDRTAGDPGDTTMRPEEEAFLRERVEACRPQVVVGSLQSVLDLEALLKEAEETGIDLRANSQVAAALDHVEKINADIRSLLSETARAAQATEPLPFPEGTEFFRDGAACTDVAGRIAAGANALAKGKPLSRDTLAEFKEAMGEVGRLLAAESGVDRVVDELGGLANFMDDDLMAANDDFRGTTGKLIADLLEFFEVKKPAAPDSTRLGEILVEQGAISAGQLQAALQRQTKLGEILKEDGAIGEAELNAALKTQESRALDKHLKAKSGDKAKTIRIDQNKLDSFAESVGELFINVDSFNFLRKRFETANVDPDTMAKFGNTVTALDDMLARLQDNVMSVRRVPVGTLFQRFPRVIRQLAASLEKNIDFRIAGEDTVIDKDLLETIENPLVHILRNSVDHGIERPADRVDRNKPAQGVLELSASVDEYNVLLVIRDDGAGIDPEKMRKVAVAKGFLPEEEAARLTDRDLVNLIFRPGFSSAERVSDVSGRGVGMDAVMAGLTKCNGRIDVASRVDEGTTVTITIPLTRTLVTKDALIVETGGQFFAIPSEDITTTAYPDSSVVRLLGGKAGVSHRGEVLRLIDMKAFFSGHPPRIPAPGDDSVLVVSERHRVVLLVDRIYSHQQIVVKVFNRNYKQFRDIPGIAGFTILGNEDVILIVDVARMASDAETGSGLPGLGMACGESRGAALVH